MKTKPPPPASPGSLPGGRGGTEDHDDGIELTRSKKIVDHFDTIDDYETWKTFVLSMAKTLSGCPSDPLLDIIFNRATMKLDIKDTEILEKMHELFADLEIGIRLDNETD